MALEKGWLAKRKQAGVKGLRPQDILGLGRDAQVLAYDQGPIRFRHRLLQEFMTAWMLILDDELREKEIGHCAQDTAWWATLFLMGGLLVSIRTMETYGQFVQHVLGDGTNDQRLFAAIGLLRSVPNPPAELANSIMTAFKTPMGEGLTENQFYAAQELGRILGDEATEAFGVLFRSSKRLTKMQGARLLCGIRGKHVNEILCAALGDKNESKITTEILGSIGEEAIEPLSTALRDSDSDVRRSAAEALGRICDPNSVEPLITALHDSVLGVRNRAAIALWKIGEPAVPALINVLCGSDSRIRRYAAIALAKIGEPSVPALIAILCNSDSDVCRSVAAVLGRIGDTRAVEPLVTMLRRPDADLGIIMKLLLFVILFPAIPQGPLYDPTVHRDVRTSAAAALGEIGSPLAVEPLIIALSDLDSEVRGYAADALGKIGDPRAVKPLIAALRDSDAFVRSEAAASLGAISESCAVKPLIAALRDSWPVVRRSAAIALGQIGDPHALPELERVAREDKEIVWIEMMDRLVAEAARKAANKIRQRMAENQEGTA